MRTIVPPLCAVLLAGCGALRACSAADVVRVTEDVAYSAGSDHPAHALDLFEPKGAATGPAVVFVHGGYWTAQDKRYYRPFTGLYSNAGYALAARGHSVAVINYRLVPEATHDEQLDDVIAAIAWTQQRFAGATLLMGHSAGGHMVTRLGFDAQRLRAGGVEPERIGGVIAMSAIFDVEHMRAAQPDGFNREVTVPVFGKATSLAAHSPLTYADPSDPRTLIFVGDADEPYLVEQTPGAAQTLRARGMAVHMHVLAGHEHADLVLNLFTDADDVTPAVREWLAASDARR